MRSRTIELAITESAGRRLKDPTNPTVYHFETYLPFTEAIKLERGNANVRPPKENGPVKKMLETVETSPEVFHLKNRGITYLCSKFKYSNETGKLVIEIPNVPKSKLNAETSPRFGIADGGHTFRVIENVGADLAIYQGDDAWVEPFVRVHFIASETGDLEIEDVVEALNTSVQVKPFTLEEYRGKFDELKRALLASGFDVDQVAFRENEDKAWQVLEIIQRLACFLKDRWKLVPPSAIYRAKDKALQMFINDENGEFAKLYPIIREVITLPEFIQSTMANNIEGHKLGKVRGVKRQPKQFRRPGTEYSSMYRMDNAIVLPMAAAFRSLLTVRDGDYGWKVSPYETFEHCAADLYEVLLGRIRLVKSATQLGADREYWMSCEKVVMSARDDIE